MRRKINITGRNYKGLHGTYSVKGKDMYDTEYAEYLMKQILDELKRIPRCSNIEVNITIETQEV